MNKVPVVLFNDRAKAQPIRQRLTESGVNAEINDSPRLPMLWLVSGKGCGVRVEVPTEQLVRTERLLLDWDASEGLLRDAIRCPECHSLRVAYPQYAEHSLLTNLFMGLSAVIGLGEKDYYCQDCHFTWPKEGTRARGDRPHLAPYYFIEGIEQTGRVPQSHSRTPQEPRKAA